MAGVFPARIQQELVVPRWLRCHRHHNHQVFSRSHWYLLLSTNDEYVNDISNNNERTCGINLTGVIW